MRAVLREWNSPPFDELSAFVTERSGRQVRSVGDRGWGEFEALDVGGDIVLVGDLTTGDDAREELDELEEFMDDLEGPAAARDAVRAHVRAATAVVGMQILPSVYDESVAAANDVIAFLEQRPGVLTQVDTVGWYDGPELLLEEPG